MGVNRSWNGRTPYLRAISLIVGFPFFVFRVKRPVARFDSELAGFVDKKCRWIGFVNNNKVEYKDKHRHNTGDLRDVSSLAFRN